VEDKGWGGEGGWGDMLDREGFIWEMNGASGRGVFVVVWSVSVKGGIGPDMRRWWKCGKERVGVWGSGDSCRALGHSSAEIEYTRRNRRIIRGPGRVRCIDWAARILTRLCHAAFVLRYNTTGGPQAVWLNKH